MSKPKRHFARKRETDTPKVGAMGKAPRRKRKLREIYVGGARVMPKTVAPGDRFLVVEDFVDEESGATWLGDDEWVSVRPTGEVVEEIPSWVMRGPDGVEQVGHPTIHPFQKRPGGPALEVASVGMWPGDTSWKAA